MSLPPYPKYKNSGVAWLGEVPEGWVFSRVKSLFNIGRGRVIAQEELKEDAVYPVYSSQTKDDGCLGYIDTYDFDCEQLTWTTDGVNAGTVFMRQGKHNCTNVCGTLVCKTNLLLMKFGFYFLQFSTPFYKRPDTNGAKIMNGEMAEIIFIVPTIEEQSAIVAFLDRETAKIDALIAEQEKLITLLAEKRQATISHAVTKGLDPNAPMKDSGVAWLGEVPEGWGVTKAKYIATRISSGKTPLGGSEVYVDEGVRFLRSQNVYDEGLRLDDVVYISEDVDESMASSRVLAGDILLNITGASIGRSCVVPEGFLSANVNQHVCVIRLIQASNIDFVGWFFKSRPVKSQIDNVQSGAAREGLNFQQIGDMTIPLPPPSEQSAIVAFLDAETARLDALTAEATRGIALLKERRAALISAAVTGKVDVREAV